MVNYGQEYTRLQDNKDYGNEKYKSLAKKYAGIIGGDSYNNNLHNKYDIGTIYTNINCDRLRDIMEHHLKSYYLAGFSVYSRSHYRDKETCWRKTSNHTRKFNPMPRACDIVGCDVTIYPKK